MTVASDPKDADGRGERDATEKRRRKKRSAAGCTMAS